MNKILVTMDTCTLSNSLVPRLDLNGIVIILEGKCHGMEKSVVTLRHPLSDEIMRQVAIVTRSNVVMTAFLPSVEVILHHMAVNTRIRVIAEVAGTLAIAECECPQTSEDSQ